jgi:hypothetical protein
MTFLGLEYSVWTPRVAPIGSKTVPGSGRPIRRARTKAVHLKRLVRFRAVFPESECRHGPGPLDLAPFGDTNMCLARIPSLVQKTNQNQQTVRNNVYFNSTAHSNFFAQVSSRPIEQRLQQWDHTAR